jgi:hypothetical protein
MLTMTAPIADGLATETIETESPRAAAMTYAKQLVRREGVALGMINYRRGPDGAIVVSVLGRATRRFVTPTFDLR